MTLRVFIINQYASTPFSGFGGRHHNLALQLSRYENLDVMLITSTYHHLLRTKNVTDKTKTALPYELLAIPTLPYHKTNGLIRILNWHIFALFTLIFLIFNFKRSVYIYSSPSIIGVLAVTLLRKVFYKNKFIFEVRDVWPLSLNYLSKSWLRRPLYYYLMIYERTAYRFADSIVSNLEGFETYLNDNSIKFKNFFWLPNGAVEEPLIYKRSRNTKSEFVICYAGSLGYSNALDVLIDIVYLIKQKNLPIKFLIAGDGPRLDELKGLKDEKKLDNLIFLGKLTKSNLRDLYAEVDCGIILWNDWPLYKYGIAANKIYEYMSNGLPIINIYYGDFDPVSRSNCGVTYSSKSTNRLALQIEKFSKTPKDELIQMGYCGIDLVRSKYNYEVIAKNYSQLIVNLMKQST